MIKVKTVEKNEQVGESKSLLSIGETCKSLLKYGWWSLRHQGTAQPLFHAASVNAKSLLKSAKWRKVFRSSTECDYEGIKILLT